MSDTILKGFDKPDEVREFPKGRFEIVQIAGVRLGRATYQPGWKWTLHNAPAAGTLLCHAPHTGVVLSGHGVVVYEGESELIFCLGRHFTSHRSHTTAGSRVTSRTCRCTYCLR